MPTLPDDLRNRLEKAVIAARDKAEDGARAALQRLYVDTADSKAIPAAFPEASRTLRVHLRAHARHLGDQVPEKGPQKIDRLVTECAYEFWHRMLFARFLAENDLLIHPDGKVSISLEDCKEFGAEETPPTEGWTFASRCASRMLPQIFRPDDPLLQVPFAPEHKLDLERTLADLPTDIFTADDSLGWVYQFWQTKRKEQVNESEVKIGGDELPAVTQLFTEHYMVLFLLHNTLGAWWVSKQAADGSKPDEVALPGYRFDYLRFRDDGTPAAGTFPGWPRAARELRVLDPCCGSGHFLGAAFELLVRIRMHDEGLSPRDACDAVLRDNLFGLELDARCTQIAAFNLALAAWKFPDAAGYRPLPRMHIACSGQAPKGKREEWLRLAGSDKRLRWGMDLLYDLFEQANDLGSLIDPRAIKAAPAMVASLDELQPLLQQALQREEVRQDVELVEAGVMAQGLARAADLLGGKYHLVLTNVPYLARGKQIPALRLFADNNHKPARADLATIFISRTLHLLSPNGTLSLVTPQNWWFLGTYEPFRDQILSAYSFRLAATLGEEAWQTFGNRGPMTVLFVLTNTEPETQNQFLGIEASDAPSIKAKIDALMKGALVIADQSVLLRGAEKRILLGRMESHQPLADRAIVSEGLHTGDYPRFGRYFWELPAIRGGWSLQQAGPSTTSLFHGREHVLLWEEGKGEVLRFVQERLKSEIVSRWIKGEQAWGKWGVAVSAMRDLKCTLYTGEIFTHGAFAIVPRDVEDLPAIWEFCKSPPFRETVRKLDKKVCVARTSIAAVPFDSAYWQAIAAANGPLPEPHSNDPTQWLFKGDIASADAPHNLQVAAARLLGYRWPDQAADNLDRFADDDGIVCLPAIGTEKGAAERVRELLAVAYGADWSSARQESLLAAAGFGGKTLHDWLRDGFFEQHCKLFQNLPFIWHIWDGRKDGFSAIVNCHNFGELRLRDLIYHHLAEWIKRQAKAVEKGESGADARHAAALELQKKLKLIHEGEEPYDIFIRWKPMENQPIGWEPDLNDGVRVNIRPFVEADILRKKPNIKWNKDKGRDPETAPWFHEFKGDRINDHHLGLEEKRKARGLGGQA